MKRIALAAAVLALAATAAFVTADDSHNHGAATKTAATKAVAASPAGAGAVTGEVVDMGCYLGHGAKGEKHIGCATKCIANGMPMGILTDDGALYLVTMNHENADPYNQLKNLAGKRVTVSGERVERNGVKGIDVTGVKPLAAATK